MTAHRALHLDVVEAQQQAARKPWVEPQGRPEQGWPLRRGSPEWAVYDPTEDDKREAMNGYEAMVLVAVVIVSAVFSTWALCMFAQHLAGLL